VPAVNGNAQVKAMEFILTATVQYFNWCNYCIWSLYVRCCFITFSFPTADASNKLMFSMEVKHLLNNFWT